MAVYKAKVEEKLPGLVNRVGIVFQYDNARHHIAISVRQLLNEHGWDVLYHPSYTTDLVLSAFHFFRALQISLEFTLLATSKHYINNFFTQKPNAFFQNEFSSCKNDGKKVTQRNGAYVIQ